MEWTTRDIKRLEAARAKALQGSFGDSAQLIRESCHMAAGDSHTADEIVGDYQAWGRRLADLAERNGWTGDPRMSSLRALGFARTVQEMRAHKLGETV